MPRQPLREWHRRQQRSLFLRAQLGRNRGGEPAQKLLGPHVLARLPAHRAAAIRGRGFFPHLIAAPFRSGLDEAFAFAIAACLVAALAFWSRGGRVVAPEQAAVEQAVD